MIYTSFDKPVNLHIKLSRKQILNKRGYFNSTTQTARGEVSHAKNAAAAAVPVCFVPHSSVRRSRLVCYACFTCNCTAHHPQAVYDTLYLPVCKQLQQICGDPVERNFRCSVPTAIMLRTLVTGKSIQISSFVCCL